MKNLLLFAVLVTLPLLVGGCGEKATVELVAEVKPIDYLQYKTEGETITITKCYNNAVGELVIPRTINGRAVTRIGDRSFRGCIGLTSITLPNGLISIDDCAFGDCVGITSITIPSSVTSLGRAVFRPLFKHCNLKSVTFLGNAPEGNHLILFGDNSEAVIYRRPEAKGWDDWLGSRPVKLISEKAINT